MEILSIFSGQSEDSSSHENHIYKIIKGPINIFTDTPIPLGVIIKDYE